ncbi:helix-turn-helix transcriptional regulator [Oceaniradius stylonematis]|uniref:helix-turn-helix transcriptional regulator n=1 Tax=Oceaniradius stylonematis TaxID=2184161 RepID=UPI00273F87D5|nr:YafY family protein [Oceaniradius stylonematis]
MRRADRLFQIVQHLRGGRLTTAARLAEQLEVSERTIYRDIADLQSTGVPIDGEAGVGYIMREGFDLPPMMFTRDEIVALVAGARMVSAWGGIAMARAAQEALVKIETVLPDTARARLKSVEIRAPAHRMSAEEREKLDTLERACEDRLVTALAYTDAEGAATDRSIWPLGLWFWGGSWTVIGWCLKREDFRMFRIDRIGTMTPTGATFRPEKGKTLRDFYAQMIECGEVPKGFDFLGTGM